MNPKEPAMFEEDMHKAINKRARDHIRDGQQHILRDEWRAAERVLRAGLKLDCDKLIRARMLSRLGLVHWIMGEDEDATECINQAFQLLKRCKGSYELKIARELRKQIRLPARRSAKKDPSRRKQERLSFVIGLLLPGLAPEAAS